MSAFELNIFIDCARDAVYDHLSEPINMIGLQPFLTEIDILKERRSAEGVEAVFHYWFRPSND